MMQTDVLHAHAGTAGVMVPYRTRLKGVVMMPYQAVTDHTTFVDNHSMPATFARSGTTLTVTSMQSAYDVINVRDLVYLQFDVATGIKSDSYVVTSVIDDMNFTVTVADAGDTSGDVTLWHDVLFHYDSTINVVTSILIPGQGVLAQNGIRVFMPAEMHCSIFYG